jgi:FKBP-type peptidyl-prolyl cis-trans isomerase FkpA/FKBP-type peptidyl-prolyl cis-trans isomerase FklB
MKRNLVLATTVVAALVFVGCDKKLDNDQKKASYAIGQQIGNNLKGQNIDFDPAVVAMSLKDIKEGKASRLKPEEMQGALQKLQEDLNKKAMEVANKNLEGAKAFMDKNKTEANVKTFPSGLQMVVVSEGKGKSPTMKDTVKAHYKGTLVTGETFDSSYDRGQPAEFPLAGVIKGWQEGLAQMKVGGKAKLFIPPELGYGPSARPQIPANSVLIFEVELLEVKAGK